MNQPSHASDHTIAATPADRRADFCKLSGRGYTQLRHLLVQLPRGSASRSSTLARVLRERKHHALVLYLFLLMCWPWLEGRRTPLEGEIWTAALDTRKGLTWSTSTLSRAWSALEKLGLVTRAREGRLLRVVPRREDGKADYTAPGGQQDLQNIYFTLPDAFWLNELFADLNLPELVMFLFFLSQTHTKDEAHYTYQQIEKWYGISESSVKKGTKGLIDRGLLNCRVEELKDSFSKSGTRNEYWYSLTGVYSQQERQMLQATARAETTKRKSKGVKDHEVEPGQTLLEDSQAGTG